MNVLELSTDLAGVPKPSRLPRVCIVTFEFVGLYKNGGIGTVCTGLAEMLAKHGHEVTVAFTRPELLSPQEFQETASLYAQEGIKLVPLYHADLPAPLHGPLVGFTCWERVSVYNWLKNQTFDIVHFSEHLGEAYYCLVARQLGLGFRDTEFWIGCHGPSQWVVESNEDIIHDMFWAYADHAERVSVATADVVWAPSRYMLDWMETNRFSFPARTLFQRYVMPDDLGEIGRRPAPASPAATARRPVQELILFGRLETRKGVKLFCQALDRLAHRLAGMKITFMGRVGTVDNRPADVYIRERAANWPFDWEIIDSFGRHDAYRYVTQPGRLAVLASPVDNSPCTAYELLELGAVFLACNAGGIPELIAPECHSTVLFDYTLASLTAQLNAVLDHGAALPEPAIHRADNEARLVAAHRCIGALAQPPEKPTDPVGSLVGVVAHEGDMAALAETVASLGSSPLVTRIVVLQSDRRGGVLDAGLQSAIPVDVVTTDELGHKGVLNRLLERSDDGYLVLRAGARIDAAGVETLARGLAVSEAAGIVPFSIRSDGAASVRPVLSGSLTYGLFEGTAAVGGILSRAALQALATAPWPILGTAPLLWFDAAVLAGLKVMPLAEPLLDETNVTAEAFRRIDERTRLSLYGTAGGGEARFVFEMAFGLRAKSTSTPAPAPAPAALSAVPVIDTLADDATFYAHLAASRSYRFGRAVVSVLRRLLAKPVQPNLPVTGDHQRHARDLLLSAAWDVGALIRLPARLLQRLR